MIRYEKERTEVHCEGDIAVFGCEVAEDGTAWVMLAEGEKGEIRREVPEEQALQMHQTGKGVLFGARDVKSFDALIQVFGAARDRLAAAAVLRPPGSPELPKRLQQLADRAEGACIALRRAALILEELLGDTDLEGDDSPEFRACQALNELLHPPQGNSVAGTRHG